jgi:hypothetical protein
MHEKSARMQILCTVLNNSVIHKSERLTISDVKERTLVLKK